jgi:hypothetical protein
LSDHLDEISRLTPVVVSLSGGGYRAAAFAAGTLLALHDSALRENVVSISSVSGGSLASALTCGAFNNVAHSSGDPMGDRVRVLTDLRRRIRPPQSSSGYPALGLTSACD